MSGLAVINQNGQKTIDSREVAEMIGMRHGDLLEKISGYLPYLTNGNFRSSDFFIESAYRDAKGEDRPCYLLTRKGCDMIANKLTGEKGVLFTAAYINKFHEMEQAALPAMTNAQLIAAIAQNLADQEQATLALSARTEKVERRLELVKDTFAKRDDENWRNNINHDLSRIVKARQVDHQTVRTESYQLLEERARCDLSSRVRNLKARLADTGAAKSKIESANKLDVIEQDAKLKEIYTVIVKEMTIRYVA